ncbi:MAG: PHP domain-containing protein [Candidatus Omnitrophica bacterium]|nr:PHP domain-containing protein [Candidatus Omnitrophota bacterium]MBU1869977.1 PHP domain-containing protein [Candidatus Omnitrophota bacterium]
MKFADLHLHTVFSDGTYTPSGLIKAASEAGLSAISVVDHDTVAGLEPCIEIGMPRGIEVLPGIELTSEYEGLEIHILGYLIDYRNNNLIKQLAILKETRIKRIYEIAAKLKELGVILKPQTVFDLAKEGTVGRLHVARAMLQEKLVGSIYEAFQKYIGDRSPAYVLGFRLSPLEAVKLIKNAGGIPVLAHPYSLRNDDLIPKFAEFGIMGLEIFYPEHSQGMINLYLDIAKKYELLVTGGSDCHGDAKPDVKIGSIKLPYELVESLKKAKERLS